MTSQKSTIFHIILLVPVLKSHELMTYYLKQNFGFRSCVASTLQSSKFWIFHIFLLHLSAQNRPQLLLCYTYKDFLYESVAYQVWLSKSRSQ